MNLFVLKLERKTCMTKGKKTSFLVGFISLCLLIVSFSVFKNNNFSNLLSNKILNNQIQDTTKNRDNNNHFFSNYDSEIIIDEVERSHTPQVFGELSEDQYPSIYHPQTFSDLTGDTPDTVEALNATSLGKIRIENEKILEETDAQIASGTLGKHRSADGQFYGKIDDDAPRIIKKVTINHMVSSRHSLSVFAPAGEILTVTIDQSIIDKTDKDHRLIIVVGFPYRENTVHAVQKKFFQKLQSAQNRMPILFKEFTITEPVTKIGSPLGGMVFLKDIPATIDQNFDITISGGVDNPSYQYGISTTEDWKLILEAPSPYAWIETPYVYFLMPKLYIKNIEELDSSLTFWYKASMLSNYAMGLDTLKGKIRPVIMMYDSYIPSGSALAYPGIFAVICPSSWAITTLDYETTFTTANCWGVIHEMNHNFQYPRVAGLGNPWTVGSNYMEITNNVMNILAYVTYTDIASSRSDSAASASGGGSAVDPYYNLSNLKSISQQKSTFEEFGESKLYAYVDLIHSFGIDKFIHFLRQIGGAEESEYLTPDQVVSASGASHNYTTTEDGFATFASQFFQYDMTDYFQDLWHFNLSQATIEKIKDLNYPKYFSLQNVYALGEKNIETGRPYIFNRNQSEVTLNLEEKTLTSADRFEVASITNIKNGTLIKNSEELYTFAPNDNYDDITFDVTYNAWFDGDETTYQKTLKVQLKFAVNKTVQAIEYSASNGYTVQQAIEQFANEEHKVKTYTTTSLSTSVTDGINLTYLSTKVIFDYKKKLTFMVYGDDATYIKINGQEAYCNQYIDAYWDYNKAKSLTENKIEIDVNPNEPILIEAYCLNTGGPGYIHVQYSEDKVNYSSILSSDCLNPNVNQQVIDDYLKDNSKPFFYDTQYDLESNLLKRMYPNNLDLTKKIQEVKCIDSQGRNIPGQNSDHFIKNLTDNNTGTWFTPNPSYNYSHYYIFDFGERVTISNVNIEFYDSSYAPSGYKYHIADNIDTTNISQSIANASNVFNRDNSAYGTKFSDQFELTNGRYLIIEITGSSAYNRSSIREISVSQSLNTEDVNIYGSSSEEFEYYNEWNPVKGNFINGLAQKTQNGEITFILEGKDLLLYFSQESASNDESYVLIDGQKYSITIDNTSSPSVFIAGLEDKQHTVTIVAKNLVFDAALTTGQILEQDELQELNLSISDFVYNGQQWKPVISYNGVILQEGVDYILKSCENNVSVGSASFSIEGKGFYKGVLDSTFEISPLELNSETVSLTIDDNNVFSGTALTPTIEITTKIDNQEVILKNGIDYDVTFNNNVSAGKASYTIQFKGNFQGTITSYFNISQKELSSNDVTISVLDETSYTGQEITPNIEIKINDQSVTLINGVDYDIVFSNNIAAGEASFTINFKGNYRGIINSTFTIAPKEVQLDSNLLSIEDQTYTGEAINPELEIYITENDRRTDLVNGVDYDVTYSNNIETGKATITIQFKGNYTRTKTFEFSIVSSNNHVETVFLISGVIAIIGIISILSAIFFVTKKKKSMSKN